MTQENLSPERVALDNMQNFELKSLDEPLQRLALSAQSARIKEIVQTFGRLNPDDWEIIPTEIQEEVAYAAQSARKFLNEISETQTLNDSERAKTASRILDLHNTVYRALSPVISYSIVRTVEFDRMSKKVDTAIRQANERNEDLQKRSQEILDDVKNVAALQGVTQQSVYFLEEADKFSENAEKWKVAALSSAAVALVFGISSLFFHKVSFFTPVTIAESIQFFSSKLLVFFILVYVMVLCSRNFLTSKHNETVNRHRQNALMTYRSLLDAGRAQETRDIVLNHAAAAIFNLHDTGYMKPADSRGASSTSTVEMIPKVSFPLSSPPA